LTYASMARRSASVRPSDESDFIRSNVDVVRCCGNARA
jgi:hypothetical protein